MQLAVGNETSLGQRRLLKKNSYRRPM